MVEMLVMVVMVVMLVMLVMVVMVMLSRDIVSGPDRESEQTANSYRAKFLGR